MSIYTRIKNLLGTFWTSVFKDAFLVDSMVSVHSMLLRRSTAAHCKWYGGLKASDHDRYADSFPFTIYLLKPTGKDASGILDVLTGGNGTVEEYTTRSLYQTLKPMYVTDHVVDYKTTLFEGVDFGFDNGRFTFYTDLSTLNIPVVRMLGDDGLPREYYRLFGWSEPSMSFKDMVASFEDPALEPYAKETWRMHQDGATVLNIKRLLAAVTGSTIAEDDCTIDLMWVEQGSICIADSNGRVYVIGTKDCALPTSDNAPDSDALEQAGVQASIGDSLKAGDPITGGIRVIPGNELKPEDLPESIAGMEVHTEAGTLIAPNSTMQCAVVDGVNVLPLQGYSSAEYYQLCARLARDPSKMRISVPSEVNPMYFIMHDIRGFNQTVILISKERTKALDAAIECIRRNMIASGILDVFYIF